MTHGFASPWSQSGAALAEVIADVLEEARARTLGLVEGLSEDALTRQHSPLMSPLVWDLGHLANYEEQWLVRALGFGRLAPEDLDGLYDAIAHPRSEREQLEVLGPEQARAYLARVRVQTLAGLSRVGTFSGDPLLHAGFVYGMVAQHEHQHAETLCATLQLMTSEAFVPPERPLPAATAPSSARSPGAPAVAAEILVPGGPFVMGTDDEPWAYDNERPAHVVEVAPFFIDRHPVTCAQFAAFIEDGGYRRRELWTEAGWAHVQQEGLEAPLFWERSPAGEGGKLPFVRRRFGLTEPVPADEPVQHVCWFEADAYARWAQKRLPTEAEWEKAASYDPASGKRRFPWGDAPCTASRANLWQGLWKPAPVGSFPEGASALGCEGLLGDVWEWTSSDFGPYPGFHPFPYREYSEVFFGGAYKVLRGGAWATHPLAMRNTFRNWDFPIRRQIFAGFRCARDAATTTGTP